MANKIVKKTYPPVGKQEYKKPEVACRNCGSDNYWQRKDGEWICPVCHPPIAV